MITGPTADNYAEEQADDLSSREGTPLVRIKHSTFPPVTATDNTNTPSAKDLIPQYFSTLFSPHKAVKNGTPEEETEKPIYRSSWGTILLQCSTHLIPLGACIVLFTFNFMGFFIGAQLSGPVNVDDDIKLHVLQFVAKAHELLMIASISIVVFDTVGHQILFGSGVPLGLIGSGFGFSQLGFFL